MLKPEEAAKPSKRGRYSIRYGEGRKSFEIFHRDGGSRDKGYWRDFSSGQRGSAIDMVADYHGLDREGEKRKIFEACLAFLGWSEDEPPPKRPKGPTPEQIAERETKRQADLERQANRIKAYVALTGPIAPGSPASSYLEGRRLDPDAGGLKWSPHIGPAPDEERRLFREQKAVGALVVLAPTEKGEVKAVQRIPLAADGAAIRDAKGNKVKLSLGKLPGTAFRLSGRDDLPEVFTEGPEDALSANLAGYRAQAGLGAGRLRALKPSDPPGATVCIFADNDAADSKATKQTDNAASDLTGIGYVVRVARAPAPRKDANDLLQAEGPEAIARCIEAAPIWTPPPPPGRSLPTYYPPRRETRAEGAFAMHKAMMETGRQNRKRADILEVRAEVTRRFNAWKEARKDELEADPLDFNEGNIPLAERRAAAKRIKAETFAEAVDKYGIDLALLSRRAQRGTPQADAIAPRLHLHQSDVGAGKSHMQSRVIREHGGGTVPFGGARVTWLSGSTLKLARQVVDEHNARAAEGEPVAMLWPGYTATDDTKPVPNRLCLRPEAMDAFIRIGGENFEQSLCDDGKGSTCAFLQQCPLQSMRRAALQEARDGERGLVLVMAHANHVMRSRAPKPHVLIADESIVGLAAEWREITVEECGAFELVPTSTDSPQLAGAINDAADAFKATMPAIVEAITGSKTGLDVAARIRAAVDRNDIVHLRDALRALAERETENIRPGLAEAIIVAWLADAKKPPIGAQIGLLNVILEEWPEPPESAPDDAMSLIEGRTPPEALPLRDHSPRIAYQPEKTGANEAPAKIQFSSRQNFKRIGQYGLSMLDATADAGMVAEALGVPPEAIETTDARGPLPLLHIRVTGKSYSKWNLTGHPGAANLRKELGEIVEAFGGYNAFVATVAKAEDQLRLVLPEGTRIGHHGALAGLNEFEACPTAFLIGREEPRPGDVEAIVATRLGEQAACLDLIGGDVDPEPNRKGEPQARRYGRQTRRLAPGHNGGPSLDDGDLIEVNALPDPRTDRQLVAIRDAALVQAAGRVRPYWNARIVWSFTTAGADGAEASNPDMPFGVNIDIAVLRAILPFALAARRNGGSLPLAKTALKAIDQATFHTPDRQLKALDNFATYPALGGGAPVIISYYENAPPYGDALIDRAEAVKRTLALLGFGLARQKVSGGPRLVLLTPDADPEAIRASLGAKPEHWSVVIRPSPTPPMLEALAAEIETKDRAWLAEHAAEIAAEGFTFNPTIRRIMAADYGDVAAPADASESGPSNQYARAPEIDALAAFGSSTRAREIDDAKHFSTTPHTRDAEFSATPTGAEPFDDFEAEALDVFGDDNVMSYAPQNGRLAADDVAAGPR